MNKNLVAILFFDNTKDNTNNELMDNMLNSIDGSNKETRQWLKNKPTYLTLARLRLLAI